ncbi:class F sortase [Nocardioides sp. R-C-SC26]|uniref:class F sortase n=1 Tax=Nocardioides sp. R-C-SC26 TaxID=2870414 RepID=UPI001E34B9FE|nr:class F sortase [Nocardioides sp. R-C-SC26]
MRVLLPALPRLVAAVASVAVTATLAVHVVTAGPDEQVMPAGVGRVIAADLAPAAQRQDVCEERPVPFRPATLYAPGVVSRSRVIHLGRGAGNVPRTAPTSPSGKNQFAYDVKDDIRAGSTQGVMKLNAHTYPDGSAAGNRLLRSLDVDDVIVVEAADGTSVCYDVVRKVQIHKSARYRPYYRTNGEPRLAIMVCSGTRLGPGDWSHRTVWFAAPRIALPFGERWRQQPREEKDDDGGSDWPFWD